MANDRRNSKGLDALGIGASLGLLLALPGLPGCRGCSDTKPYTPFGMASALPEAEPSASAPPPPIGDAGPPIEKAIFAPAGSQRWLLGGQELVAKAGFVFEQAVTGDFDEDGSADAVAWLTPSSDAGAPARPGEAWYFAARAEPKQLAQLPGFVPTAPTCSLTTALSRTGLHSVTLDFRADCQGALIQRAPTRALLVLAPGGEHAQLLLLRAATAAPDETLELSATTADRDGDGRDDVEVHVAVGSPGGTPLDAPLVWLDRAAGPARDTAEPRRTLERLAAREAARAKTKKLADDVVRRVGAIRRLLSALCAEGATPRVFDADGNGFGCGPLGGVVDSLLSAEIGAELARGRVLEAFGALSRDGWYFGKASLAARKRLEKALLDSVKPVTASVIFLDVHALLPTPPRYSPLTFEPNGALLVRTADGLLRVEPEGTTATPAEPDGSSPPPLDVVSDSGSRFLGVAYSCDRSETTLLVSDPKGSTSPAPTTLLAPRPGACGRTRFEALPALEPVGFLADKLLALVGGALVGGDTALGIVPPGSARSPDGRWLVAPTAFGALLVGPEARLLELGPSVTSPLRLTDCVPANDGQRIACVLEGRVLVARAGGS